RAAAATTAHHATARYGNGQGQVPELAHAAATLASSEDRGALTPWTVQGGAGPARRGAQRWSAAQPPAVAVGDETAHLTRREAGAALAGTAPYQVRSAPAVPFLRGDPLRVVQLRPHQVQVDIHPRR